MRSAKKPEPEFTTELTPEQEAELEAGLAAIERGEYIEIGPEVPDADILTELRRLAALRKRA
jgi:hypothetical protein